VLDDAKLAFCGKTNLVVPLVEYDWIENRIKIKLS